ncbi:hypothetical protein [Paludisphaera rhizosphaerae]|uniref:hypothetical protein n=1 Tax=Paludisphaera rhizosphaerae TaxID=2711216 RepID=UPI0013EB65AE|nr:hypothetical protein [Paludisphaera rhizosphaerae]
MAAVACDPISVFDKSFSISLQAAALEVVRQMYREAQPLSEQIAKGPHGKDLLPHVRRGGIQTRLEEVACSHEGVQVRTEFNRSGNAHIVIEGPNIILTESFARSKSKVVRPAAFRRNDSMQNYPLLENLEPPDDITTEMKFNAVLLHGYGARGGIDLGFALIRFPSPGFKSYQPEMINLLERFPAGVPISQSYAMEEIPDLLEPKMRSDIPVRKGS